MLKKIGSSFLRYTSYLTKTFGPSFQTIFPFLMTMIQINRTGIVDKFKCYGIYALMDPFIDRQPVN